MAEGVVANEINRTILESSNISDEQQTTNLPKKKKMVKRKPARKQVSFIFFVYLLFFISCFNRPFFPFLLSFKLSSLFLSASSSLLRLKLDK